MIQRFFILFITTILFLNQQQSQASDIKDQVDLYDKIAIDHTTLTFKYYDQHLKKPQIHDESPIWGFAKQWHAIPDNVTNGWTFYPVMGKTGGKINTKCCHEISLQYRSLMGIVGYNPTLNLLTIAFRGSQQSSDWINNLNPGRRSLKNANDPFLLHSGYVQIFEKTKKSLINAIKNALENISHSKMKELTVLCTGHSLGGSLATITAYYLADQDKFDIIELRTFAPPPVGDKDFNVWMEDNISVAKTFWRQMDICPYYLPNCYGLYPTGKNIVFPYDGNIFSCIHPFAHDNRQYQKHIYEALDLEKNYLCFYNIIIGFPFGYRLRF